MSSTYLTRLFSLCIILSSVLFSAINCRPDGVKKIWYYSSQDLWEDECKGENQSPINIHTESVSVNKSMAINRKNYDLGYKDFKVINNGFSIQVELTGKEHDGKLPTITGTAINNQVYVFAQFHFHWSHEQDKGAEHSIDDHHHPVEMHFVHYNKKYKNIANAVNNSDGIAVMAIYFDKESKDNELLETLVSRIKKVVKQGEFFNLKEKADKPPVLTFNDLLPKTLKRFYKYQGSLTTPPCAESVTWIIFDTPNHIGESQFKKSFKSVLSKDEKPMTNTFRQKQELNDRKVETNEELQDKSEDHEEDHKESKKKVKKNDKKDKKVDKKDEKVDKKDKKVDKKDEKVDKKDKKVDKKDKKVDKKDEKVDKKDEEDNEDHKKEEDNKEHNKEEDNKEE